MSRSFGNHLSFSVNHGGELKNKRLNINFVFFCSFLLSGCRAGFFRFGSRLLESKKTIWKASVQFSGNFQLRHRKIKRPVYPWHLHRSVEKKKVAEIRILSFLIINYMTKLYA